MLRVVDASALAAILFGEPEGAMMAEQLDGARLAAPPLLAFELANVCLVKCRRYPEKRDALLEAFRLRDAFAVEVVNVDIAEALTLAMQTGLTVYDAVYLWLARRLGAELTTLDKALARAASGGL